ncbi:nuclear pore complex assembly-domain-containing protein [Dendryphion nanum]|uniref:Nuclear pore complex assembly-domain-containing protein n=1 Tax=Dendryphion nanum TaxID=256645 RepID=A0A9P9EIR1_9PLEO|nr:nuclear pore complex assembly-domain-containing protein [Dendryphion nanum]
MLDIEDFDAVFRGNSYSSELVLEIERFKKIVGGKCFYERLLELLHIKYLAAGRRIYPPNSKDLLHELHKRIVSAPIALHYKHCLLFYLLKDLSPTFHDQNELASTFAGKVHLEKKFWTFIEGLWALDHVQFETAVGNLTHPSIIPTFPDEIMLVLLTRRNLESVPTADILPLAYYNCTNPPLANAEVKTEFVRYMANRDVTETFYWIRARPEHEHKQLLELLVEQTLHKHAHNQDESEVYPREVRAIEFVGLPFSEEEERWVETFLTEGKGRNFSGAADTVTMRRIAMGRLADVTRDGMAKGKRIEGVNWDVLKDGVKRGLGPRQSEGRFTV